MTEIERRSFKDYFSEGSARYAAYRPTYPPELAAYLATLCSRHDLAWDCGCGSGQLSRLLAEHFLHVVATDASAAQIAEAPVVPKVEYRCAPAEHSGLQRETADLVVAAQAAHWFDLPAFYAESVRVGRPGATVALISYGLLTVNAPVDKTIGRFYRETLKNYWPAERRHVDEGYRSLNFPFREVDPPSFLMSRHWVLAELLGYIRTWSAVRELTQDQGPVVLETFEGQLTHAWGEPAIVRAIHWPIAMRAGRIGT